MHHKRQSQISNSTTLKSIIILEKQTWELTSKRIRSPSSCCRARISLRKPIDHHRRVSDEKISKICVNNILLNVLQSVTERRLTPCEEEEKVRKTKRRWKWAEKSLINWWSLCTDDQWSMLRKHSSTPKHQLTRGEASFESTQYV